jgi:hypothetical protein
MDLLGYAALGGLERLTIVAGAVIIGYWGYRLYTAEKNAGLIFMGLAVVVLVGALATGGSYLRSVGEGYQLASLPAEAASEDSPFVEEPVPAAAAAPEAPEAPAAASPAVAPEAASAAAETAVEPSAEVAAEAAEPPAPSVTADAPAASPVEPAAAESAESPVRLATGAELGGRIVSVKSENVSLEWSTDSDESGSDSGSE